MRHLLAVPVMLAVTLNAQSPPQEFEVATIKRNVSADPATAMRRMANGQEDMVNVTAQTLISRRSRFAGVARSSGYRHGRNMTVTT